MRASSPAVPNDPRHAAPAASPDGYMEAAGDVAFRLDPSGLILHASQRAERLIGTMPLAGTVLTTLAVDADQAALRNALVDAGTATRQAAAESDTALCFLVPAGIFR